MAESLKDWLPLVIQVAQPFVSSQDIAAGERGLRVIAQELEETSSGIICVTRENSLAPWINFEAGALSKTVGESRVIPCLLDLPPTDLTGPIAQFQAVSSSDKGKVLDMLRSLRDHAGLTHPTDEQLGRAFTAFWPDLEAKFDEARQVNSQAASATPSRDTDEILEEVLVLARRQEGVLRTIAERMDSSVPMQQIRKSGTSASSERPEIHRGLLDQLLAELPLPEDHARAYRVVTDRTPAEIQVVYDAGTITSANVEMVRDTAELFAGVHNHPVTIRAADGYEISVGITGTAIVTPPSKPTDGTAEHLPEIQ